jgi:hypothetical protein
MNEHILIDININIYIDKYTCEKIGRISMCFIHNSYMHITYTSMNRDLRYKKDKKKTPFVYLSRNSLDDVFIIIQVFALA